VADTFDALTSNPPFKREWPSAMAWVFLKQQAGTQFDPACVAAFERGQREVEDVQRSFPNGGAEGQAPAERAG
jgi:response regulator RpfG family c-di-GMP phosphodiesterase